MPIRWAFLKRALAGAVFGVYMAHLLYFLNPQVNVTPMRLIFVTIVYALICAAIFGTVLWALRALRVRTIGRPDNDGAAYRTHGFGFVVLAAFAAAAIYWMQRQVFFIYLPIGAQRGLAKATNLITVNAFVLLLLWVVERSASRTRSRLVFIAGVLVIGASAFALYGGRERYRSEPQRAVIANVGAVAGHRPLIVVAIRNLPYDWIVTLAGEGSLRFFEQARTQAYLTRLEPFPTTNQAALWASLATGKLPFRHGVTGEFSYGSVMNGFDRSEPFVVFPSGIGFQWWQLIPPVRRFSAQLPSGDALPLWSLLERIGVPSAVIAWPNNARQVWPASVTAAASRSGAPSAQTMARFRDAGAAFPRIIRALTADVRAIDIARGAAATFPITVVSLRGFEEAQRAIHIFSNELPPRSAVKGEVAREYVEELDAMLLSLAQEFPGHVIVVASPSAPVAPKLPATPFELVRDFVIADDPGADDGFVLMRGPGVVHRERVAPAQSVDIVPTCLYASGLPVGRDMDGRVLSDAFSDDVLRANALTLVPTYEAEQLQVRRGGG
jgi:hypothetical protein